MSLVERTGSSPINGSHTGGSSGFKYIIVVIILVILLVLGVLGYSYFRIQNSIVDNPTINEIKVRVDGGQEKTIPAGQTAEIKVPFGTHKLYLNGEEVGSFDNKFYFMRLLNFEKSVLNPTTSSYVIVSMAYEAHTGVAPDSALKSDVEKKNLFLEATWNYGLDEKFPGEVKLPRGKKYVIKTKLYRMSDYEKEFYPDGIPQ